MLDTSILIDLTTVPTGEGDDTRADYLSTLRPHLWHAGLISGGGSLQ